MVEEADFKVFAKKGDEKSLDRFIPKSESDFLEYAELISHKLRSFEESYHYIGLLKAIMRLSVTAMKAADAKEVSASVTAIANEKIKLRKKPTLAKRSKLVKWNHWFRKGKIFSGKRKQLHADKPEDDLVVNPYDTLDDYDFMKSVSVIGITFLGSAFFIYSNFHYWND
ncbi:hypothetical protein DKX38_027441 [Salix brachista]|uniref:Uncharacterized protein n=1 Tax=Salix brachista TaxID=2182728 RepID=A0A5N5JH47_9ROSI|nr:hypothetical protein DKX38_027441 [Salix brachista]